jgi:hypothetical protein
MSFGGAGLAPETTAAFTVNVFDGTAQPYSGAEPILYTIRDGNQKEVSRDFHNTSSVVFRDLPVFQNAGDNYTIIAAAKGSKDAGFFPVKARAGTNQIVDLMLLPDSSSFNFSTAKWPLPGAPKLRPLFCCGATDDSAAALRYSDLEDFQAGAPLACLLNITTALDQIQLRKKTALDYFKEVIWDREGLNKIAQDRFYAWVDPALVDQVKLAKHQGMFVDAPFILHPGATSSYKQIQFGEANVQLTFHENDRKEINGVNCIMVEPDIDYYKDPGAHLLLEVSVNAFGSITDPKTVYVLRWIAGQRAGLPEFNPQYTIQRA